MVPTGGIPLLQEQHKDDICGLLLLPLAAHMMGVRGIIYSASHYTFSRLQSSPLEALRKGNISSRIQNPGGTKVV